VSLSITARPLYEITQKFSCLGMKS